MTLSHSKSKMDLEAGLGNCAIGMSEAGSAKHLKISRGAEKPRERKRGSSSAIQMDNWASPAARTSGLLLQWEENVARNHPEPLA